MRYENTKMTEHTYSSGAPLNNMSI